MQRQRLGHPSIGVVVSKLLAVDFHFLSMPGEG